VSGIGRDAGPLDRPAEGPAEPPGGLTHVDAAGQARMVDVSAKPATRRRAVAEGRIRMAADTARRIAAGDAPKGDVLGTARLAGIMAGKRAAELIPLCHPLPGATLSVDLTVDEALPGVRARAEALVEASTGVEMEALTAVSVALLTVYDMAKALDRGMVIEGVRLVLKEGGRSGRWEAPESGV
jgi:cyclic pyranopterin phosphate synthase